MFCKDLKIPWLLIIAVSCQTLIIAPYYGCFQVNYYIQGRAVGFVLDDYVSDYDALFKKADVPGIKIMLQRYLAIEVYKCGNDINPDYLIRLFVEKECPYSFRDIYTVKPTQHGIKSFKSYGAKIWNALPKLYKSAFSLHEFKSLIKTWNDRNCKCVVCDVYLNLDIFYLSIFYFSYPQSLHIELLFAVRFSHASWLIDRHWWSNLQGYG